MTFKQQRSLVNLIDNTIVTVYSDRLLQRLHFRANVSWEYEDMMEIFMMGRLGKSSSRRP